MPRSDVRKLVLRLAEADQGWITAWRQALPSDEIAVADRFRDPSDRLAAMAAKALLRVCLGAATGQPPAMIALDRDALGRPFMPQAPLLRFSQSHTRGLVAVALHDHEIGCDAEPLDRVVPPDAIEVLAEEERSALHRLPAGRERDIGFLRLWTVKEAYVKALGVGLSVAPADHAFAITDDTIRLLRPAEGHADAGDWSFSATIFKNTHILASAARHADGSCVWTPVTARQLAEAATGG